MGDIERWLWLRHELRKRKIYDLADYVRAMVEAIYEIEVYDTKESYGWTDAKLPGER